MRTTAAILLLIAPSVVLSAQGTADQPSATPARPRIVQSQPADVETLRLTVDQAVKMALAQNVDLAVDRLEPQIGETQVAAAAGSFRPVFNTGLQENNQLDPPANLLTPVATRTNALTSQVGVTQALPWLGTSYNVQFNAVHTNSNSFLNTFDPLVQSGLSFNVSQPLIRNRAIDSARHQLATSRLERDVAEARFRESTVHTTAMVKSAYWNLASAIANVGARKTALALAEDLVRVNKVKVDVGQSPPVDLISARAEVAADQEQLIIAETAVKQTEDHLRTLIFDASDVSAWRVKIEPVDLLPVTAGPLDLDAAVANALTSRTDLLRAKKAIDEAQATVQFTENQTLPDVRLTAGYFASGLGGTQVLRSDGFPGAVIGTGSVTGFGSILSDVLTGRYATWTAGVNVSYPIGQATERANFARAKLERRQSEERLKSAEMQVIQQVRDAGWKVEMNSRRSDTTRAARELAEQRLSDERKRFDVGVSTSFLVIQAQRDLAQARANELAAILAYDLALVDFEALQQAGPVPAQQQVTDVSTSSR